MTVIYGTAALRRLREQQAAEPARQPSLLDQVPADAPIEEPGATVHAWDGDRFVPYQKWLAKAPIVRVAPEEERRPTPPADATVVAATCEGTKVWLAKDGERWLMYVGSRRTGRRHDFATPFLAHAIYTAEQWYGVPAAGWRAEKGRDEDAVQAPDLSPAADNQGELVHGVAVDGDKPGR